MLKGRFRLYAETKQNATKTLRHETSAPNSHSENTCFVKPAKFPGGVWSRPIQETTWRVPDPPWKFSRFFVTIDLHALSIY